MPQFFVVWGKCCFMWSQRVDIRVILDSDSLMCQTWPPQMWCIQNLWWWDFMKADGWKDLGVHHQHSQLNVVGVCQLKSLKCLWWLLEHLMQLWPAVWYTPFNCHGFVVSGLISRFRQPGKVWTVYLKLNNWWKQTDGTGASSLHREGEMLSARADNKRLSVCTRVLLMCPYLELVRLRRERRHRGSGWNLETIEVEWRLGRQVCFCELRTRKQTEQRNYWGVRTTARD